MTNLAALKEANANRWAHAKLTRNFQYTAEALVKPDAKKRYLAVEARTGVPWFVIAVIHEREADQKWNTQLGQGDPLDRVSVHVPRGRGPFSTWEDGAYDALVNCAPYAARNKDWGIGGVLTLLESYNGLGYAGKGLPSPYIWSGTDQYHSGKYVADGKFDANEIDTQPGCAGLLMAMAELDPSIKLGHADGTPVVVPASAPKAAPAKPTTPSFTNPAKGSVGEAIASILTSALSAFKRK